MPTSQLVFFRGKGVALLTAAYIVNRVPSEGIVANPYELWHGRKPSLEHLCP